MFMLVLFACGDHEVGDNSTFDVDRYAEEAMELQQERLTEGGVELRTTLSFNEPVTVQDVADFLWPDQLRFTYAYFRDEAGQVITVGTRAPLHDLEAAIRPFGERAVPIGIGAVVADLEAEEVELLQKDDRVFLADVSADNYFTGATVDRGHARSLAWELWGLQ